METVKVIEPRSNVKADEQKNHVVIKGGLRYTEQLHVADSYNNTQALFTVYPPSTHTITDRLFRVRAYLRITSADGAFQVGTNDGLRQFPLASILDVLTVQINGESLSDNLADKIHALLCYGNEPSDRNKTWSTTPSMPDQYQKYSDWTTYGSGRNPLAEYGEVSNEMSRGGFITENIVSPTVREYIITEPMLISPFYNGLGTQEEGMVNVNQFNLSFRWKTELSRVWSHASTGNAISGLAVEFYREPELLTTFITPDMTHQIPALQTLPYHKSMDYLKSVSAFNIGETRRVYSDSIKLSQIPRRLYIFLQKRRADKDFNDADVFGRIKRLDVLWNNQSGLFANASEQDLFEMSRRNGCNLSWSQWAHHRGSVLCVEFGTQLGLLDNESPGVRGQYTIQVQVDVENILGEAYEAELFTVFVMEGAFQISENMGRATLGNLTADVAFEAKASPEMDYQKYEQLKGGGFFSSLKSFVNKVASGVGSVANLGARVLPLVPELAPFAQALPAISAGAHLAQKLTGGGLSGGRLSGGQLMSRSQMKKKPRRRRR